MTDTIFALATAPLQGPRAVMRLSGDDAITIACAIAVARAESTELLPNRGAYPVWIRLQLGQLPGELWLMPGPKSATGEHCAELHLPGNPILIEMLEAALLKRGARRAEAGEFSRRAYLNGRLDLAQAESVMALVSSADAESARRARRVLSGRFSRDLSALCSNLEDLCAHFEVSFDFDEEAAEQSDEAQFLDAAQDLATRLREVSGLHRVHGDGLPRVVLAGPTNAGKSTFLNALVGKTRVAVADEDGTTRDSIRVGAVVNDIPLVIIDTAGLKQATNLIEEQALQRTESHASQADLLVLVCSGTSSVNELESLAKAYQRWCEFDTSLPARTLVLFSKLDLWREPPELPKLFSTLPWSSCSAQIGTSLAEAQSAIVAHVMRLMQPEGINVSARANDLLLHARACLDDAAAGLEAGAPLEAISDVARSALKAIREVLGEEPSSDVLDHIFSNFCIGK